MSAEASDVDVQDMLDHFAIERLLKRYARALDEKNYDALDTVFTPDAELDFTCAGGIAGTYPQVKAWLMEVLDPISEMQHFTTNVESRVAGDGAVGTSYTLNVNGMNDVAGAIQHMIVGAKYIDEYRRTPDGWRISARREERLTMFGRAFGPEISS